MAKKFKINLNEFGKRLREGREKNNLTRPEACTLLNISKSTLQAWENGEREPGVSHLIEIINIYAVTFEWLITGNTVLNKPVDCTTSLPTISQEWASILNTVNDEDKEIALRNIINNGFKTLLVDVNANHSKPSNFKQSIMNLLLELNEEDAKEILSNIGNRRSAHQPAQKQA